MASCKPLAIEGNTVILGFDFPILKDKFERWPEARENVTELLSDLLGRKCLVRAVVTEQYTPPSSATEIDPAEFNALAQELGGEAQL
jgi:hypothetical protein